MSRKHALSGPLAAKLFSQAISGLSWRVTQMTLVKAIVAMILALGALTTTFSFHSSEVQAIPKCFPCSQ
jgi:hypothetical protein